MNKNPAMGYRLWAMGLEDLLPIASRLSPIACFTGEIYDP